jgi:hypothetical protein
MWMGSFEADRNCGWR